MLRNGVAIVAVAFSLQACFKGKAQLGTCGVSSDCASGSTCNLSLHVCEYACPQRCTVNQQCLNGACVATDCLPACDSNHACDKIQAPPKCIDRTQGVATLVRPQPGDVVGGTQLPVEAIAGAPGNGPTKVVFRIEQGGAIRSTFTATAGVAGDYSGVLPLSGRGLVSGPAKVFAATYWSVNGVEQNNDSVPADVTVDDGPAFTAPAIVGGAVGQDGNRWFAFDAAAMLDISATISSAGSGLNASTVRLQNGAGVRLDDGNPTISGTTRTPQGTIKSSTYTFHVPRNLLGASAEGTVTFNIVAQDNSGRQRASSTGVFGLDGAKPVVTVVVAYPAAGAGCFSDPSVYCGHDGGHFWRNESATLSFTVTDLGSGVSAVGGTCTAGTASGGCTKATFPLPFTFNGAVATDTHGNGTIPITASGQDLVGNSSTDIVSVAFTRAKWVRSSPVVGLVNLAGSPVVTTLPVSQVIFGGTNGAGDPIVSLSTAGTAAGTLPGAKLWSTGHLLSPVITSVTANMAYDPTTSALTTRPTPVLYVNDNAITYALHISAAGVDQYCTSTIGATATVGAASILSAGSQSSAVVVGDNNSIVAVSNLGMARSGGACVNTSTRLLIGLSTPILGPPSSNATNIYFGYDNNANQTGDRGFGSVTFAAGAFGTSSTTRLGFAPTAGTTAAAIAIPGDLFFANNKNGVFYRYDVNAVSKWLSTPPLVDNIFAQPTLKGNSIFGSSSALYAYSKADGTQTWQYPAGAVTQVTPPTFGADGSLYFSDSKNTEIVAIDSSQKLKWSYIGNPATAPPTNLSSIATEAAMGADGTLYFGDSSGKIYALITDTTPAPTVAGDWPKTGFDNCNSGNASNPGYVCQ